MGAPPGNWRPGGREPSPTKSRSGPPTGPAPENVMRQILSAADESGNATAVCLVHGCRIRGSLPTEPELEGWRRGSLRRGLLADGGRAARQRLADPADAMAT